MNDSQCLVLEFLIEKRKQKLCDFSYLDLVDTILYLSNVLQLVHYICHAIHFPVQIKEKSKERKTIVSMKLNSLKAM